MPADRTADDFGGRLRAARERRGVSLRAIAQATKISAGALEALERNDISRLPGGIFSRAFVRSYASEIGLDPEETVRDFMARFPDDSVTVGHPLSKQGDDKQALPSGRRLGITLLRLVLISVPFAVAMLYMGVGRRTARPVPERAAPAEELAAGTIPGEVTPTDASAASVADAPRPPATGFTVALVANRRSWLSATADGSKTVDKMLEPGDQQTLDVERELVLVVGDAGAVRMTVNGASAKPLGKDGKAVTVRLNPSNYRQYLAAEP
jgi:cytoskeletal protein RodZ